jgi:hypothetical protein
MHVVLSVRCAKGSPGNSIRALEEVCLCNAGGGSEWLLYANPFYVRMNEVVSFEQ